MYVYGIEYTVIAVALEASHCHYSNKINCWYIKTWSPVILSVRAIWWQLILFSIDIFIFYFLMKMCMYGALWLLIYLFKQNHAMKFVVVLYNFYLKTKKIPQNLQIIHLFKKNPYDDLILLRNTSSRSFYLFTSNIFLICFH